MSLIDRQAVLALPRNRIRNMRGEIVEETINVAYVEQLPSAQSESCDGCKWEYAFGYGECHHCKRSYNDMYEVKDEG